MYAVRLTLLLVLSSLLAGKTVASDPELIPREVLFGNPEKSSPQLSPDGKRMAYLAPVNNVLNVWVKTIGKEDDRAVTKDSVRGIRRYFWAYDNQHLMYLQDVGGNENWRLYGVELASNTVKDFTPYDSVQVQIVGTDKNFPDEVLIGMNKEDARLHDVYRLTLSGGTMKLVDKNPGNVIGWVADAQFKLRGAMASTEDGGFDLMVRETDEGEWRKLLTWDAENGLSSTALGFSKDGKWIYAIDSRDANAGRLVKINLADARREVLAADEEYDVYEVVVHPETYEIQAVSFAKDRAEWKVIDPSIGEDFKRLTELTRGDFSLVSRDLSDKTWLVTYTVDNGPIPTYAYDRTTGKSVFLFFNRPALKKYSLATIEPISFVARDGMKIHGYLALPEGKSKNLPLVLNVHGGPWSRDTWGYDGEVQWLVNRGYACLQVNFRGSTGYGKKFLNAGDREWGAKMHDDLVDAVEWAVKNGYADPKKVAIYGGSYGGYAALVGATFTPDLFACAVDIVGPSNLITLIKSIPPYWSTFLATFHKRLGNPDTEAEFLKSRSPLFKVDQIKIPILIAQGANDPRVKQAESEQIVAAMKEKGLQYEYMLFPDEGHGFARPENRIKFYMGAEKFLAKHLGGKYLGETP